MQLVQYRVCDKQQGFSETYDKLFSTAWTRNIEQRWSVRELSKWSFARNRRSDQSVKHPRAMW